MNLRRRLILALLAPLVPAAALAVSPAALDLATSVSSAEFARGLAGALDGRKIQLRLHKVGSERALDELRAGNVDAALISRSLSDAERREFRATPVAMDSLLLIVNERNALTDADRTLVRRIFAREIADWSQVGAGGGGSIVPVTRRAIDGTRTVFDNAFGIGRVIPSGIVELASNLAAALYVAADPLAIGYVSAETLADARRRGLPLRAVRLEGEAPTAVECLSARYPLCRPILLVRRAGRSSETLPKVEAFLRSDEGLTLLRRHGFAGMAAP